MDVGCSMILYVYAVELLPAGLGVGALVTGGKGGSTTSLLFRTGYGASASGRYPELMSEKRLPG